jgi:hypothetical protein
VLGFFQIDMHSARGGAIGAQSQLMPQLHDIAAAAQEDVMARNPWKTPETTSETTTGNPQKVADIPIQTNAANAVPAAPSKSSSAPAATSTSSPRCGR